MLDLKTGRPWHFAIMVAALLLIGAGCTEDRIGPLDVERDAASAFETLLSCKVDVSAASLECGATSPATAGAEGGAALNLIVGGQHQFVRLTSDQVEVEGGVFSADVTVQNLTLQPFGTIDGTTAHAEGVRVFFVDEPNNGVVVKNPDDVAPFLGSTPADYFEYSGAVLGGAGILGQGEVSDPKNWQFELNGAEDFEFSVLVSTTVPDRRAYSVHLSSVVAGYYHACGEGSDDKIYCWGWNNYGQLGDGTTTDRPTPVEVIAPEGVTLSRLTAGQFHNCAEGSDERIYCWGANHYGQLGNGTTSPDQQLTPVMVETGEVPPGVRLSGIAAGRDFTCAEGSDGNAYCWGNGLFYGQLGNGEMTVSTTPVAVQRGEAPLGTTFSGLATGDGHACAMGSDGEIYCWGRNNRGQLGDGTSANESKPVRVRPGEVPEHVTLSRLAAGSNHTCAEGSDGKVYCWGGSDYGQLGNGETTGSTTPVAVLPGEVPGHVTLSGLVAGTNHSCVLGSDDNAYCWGHNSSGQLGFGVQAGSRKEPVKMVTPHGVVLSGLTAGSDFSCAVSEERAYCWGSGDEGRLGDGMGTNQSVPSGVAATRGR